MVYESSTRRIYSSATPRPVISTSYSYSPVGPIPVVTKLRSHPHLVLAYTPGISKGHIINPIGIPRVAHKRIVAVSPPPRRGLNGQNYYDMLESGIQGNFGNRIILVRYRPTPPPVPQSKVVYIEDVTDPCGSRLLRRELSPTPFYGSPWELTTPIPRPMFSLHNIPLRETTHAQLLIPSVGLRNIRWSASEVKEIADMRRLYVRDRNPDVGYSPLNKALMYRMPSPCYVDPSITQNYCNIGRGNLACLSFYGGRPIPKRRRFYPDYDDKIRDEVIFRSFYTNLRDAASSKRNAGKRPIYQPIYYSKKTIFGAENIPKREVKESKWVERAMANEKPPVPRPAKAKPAPIATEINISPPRKESLKLEPPATPPPIKPINVTLPGPRKSITEIVPEPKIENLPDESVTVKMPPKEATPPPKEPTPPPKEPTPPPKEPTPPPKEPTPPPKEATPPPKELTPPPKEPTPPPKESTPPPKEATPPPKEPTPPPKEPTPPPKEPTPPPKEPTPPPKEPTPPPPEPELTQEPEPAAAAEEAAPPSEPVSEEVSPAAPSGDEASNKGEVEDLLDDEVTQDEVCDLEENDVEIASADDDDPESQSAPVEEQAPVTPQETEGSTNASEEQHIEPAATEEAVKAPENDQDAVTPVSIVVADIDGPLPISPPGEGAPAVQEEPLTVEQIQAEAERRRAEFAQLLEEHAELVTQVTKLEKVAVIVSKSCAEALAQQEHHEEQPPPTDSQKSK